MDSFSEKPKKKTSAGRRKIPIQKIQEKSKRNVAFSKRRQGLFKKAAELSTLCGSEVAVVAYSEGGKAFAFGHPSPDSVINRYLQHHGDSPSSSVSVQPQGLSSIQNLGDSTGCLDGVGLEELEEYAHGLQMLLNMVNAKATSSTPTTSSLLVVNHPPPAEEVEFSAYVEDDVICPLAAATPEEEEEFSSDVDNVICPLAAAAAEEEFSADMDDVICPLAASEEEFSADVYGVICPLVAAAEEEEEFGDVIIPSLGQLMEMERIFDGCFVS